MSLDPQDPPQAAPSTTATDASQTPIHDAWQQWTSNPSNNAALLQFGISMLQPRSPGQSGIGAAANAVADAGGAAGRVQSAQDARDLADENQTAQEAKTAAITSNAASTATNADAYRQAVANAGDLASGKSSVSRELMAQRSFQSWALKPEDPLNVQMNNGNSTDPIVQALQRVHPDIKTKSDIVSNSVYAKEAKGLIAQSNSGLVGDGGDEASVAVPASPSAPVAPTFPPSGTQRAFKNNSTGQVDNFVSNGTSWVKQ